MTRKRLLTMLRVAAFILLLILIMQPLSIWHFGQNIAMLFPKGWIALEERNLLLVIQALMLLVILPVYLLTFIFSWKYRAQNKRARYDPDLVDNRFAEYVWWGLPLVMTTLVAVLTWVKTYQLDPFKPLQSDKKPLTVQVVALQWKWLFIYPEEKIASLNFFQIPVETPIHFEITADAPMNSFWIPALGGQIYAMPNMKTELNLIANKTGDFSGASANLSGEGFAGMHFVTRAVSEEDFRGWVESVQGSEQVLEFEKLALPSKNSPVAVFKLNDPKIFHTILMKHMKE